MKRLSVIPLLGLLWACSGESPGTRPATGSDGSGASGTSMGTGGAASGASNGTSTNGNSTNGNSTTSGGGAGGTSGGPIQFDLDCAAPAVGPPALRMLTRQELHNTLNDVFPQIAGQWQSTLPSNQVSSAGFDNSVSNSVGNQMAEKLLETAEAVADAVIGNALATLLPCSTSSPDRACAEQFVNQYGTRLFRRPLTTTEVERYLTFFDSALATTDFTTALRWLTVGLIQSPGAVYRSEIGVDMGDGTRQLGPYELATELAYTYTGSAPSEELLNSAAGGDLGDLVAQAAGLLETERGKQALLRFFEGYLQYTGVASTQRPNVSGFDAAKLDMLEETRAFIDNIVFQAGGGLRELLTAPTTNPTAALASYYSFPAPASDFASIDRPAGQGIGILAQGSFLASHANSVASSPTHRGLFPFLRLLCQPKPELPPDVPQLTDPEPGVKTTRQRYEETHAAVPVCANCHKQFDPIGFGFEHFDEGGRYRDQEVGLPIDATGTVIDAAGGELFSFDGQEQLVSGLVEQSVVYQCFSAYLATYAFGTAQSCLGPTKAGELESGSIGIASAFAALAAEPHFTRRTGQ
jgi:hypothetical protein